MALLCGLSWKENYLLYDTMHACVYFIWKGFWFGFSGREGVLKDGRAYELS